MNTVESILLADEAQTLRLGQVLAHTLPAANAVLYLQGELGAGKTTLARGLLHALGITGPVRSPTYTLIERYPFATGEAVHMDLYRIADPAEIEYLGLDEAGNAVRLWLIEWPERGVGSLPAADLCLRLALAGQGRMAELQACSPQGLVWCKQAFSRLVPMQITGKAQ